MKKKEQHKMSPCKLKQYIKILHKWWGGGEYLLHIKNSRKKILHKSRDGCILNYKFLRDHKI